MTGVCSRSVPFHEPFQVNFLAIDPDGFGGLDSNPAAITVYTDDRDLDLGPVRECRNNDFTSFAHENQH